ncbi:MAG: hypothetical protein QNJ54_34485 [Prochloraceae cyanobacterium]|nr:hypothetical protein [Prochloraceae cyanobacterium]
MINSLGDRYSSFSFLPNQLATKWEISIAPMKPTSAIVNLLSSGKCHTVWRLG